MNAREAEIILTWHENYNNPLRCSCPECRCDYKRALLDMQALAVQAKKKLRAARRRVN